MPDVTDPKQFQLLVGLQRVCIEETEKQGVAYVYLSLDPKWDIEHDMAAIVHKNRVVAVGNHDSMWKVAERDAGE